MTRLFGQIDWSSIRLRAVLLLFSGTVFLLSLPTLSSAEKIPEIELIPQEQVRLKAHQAGVSEEASDYNPLWQLLAGTGLAFLTLLYWNRQLRLKVAENTADLTESESLFRATFEQAAVGIAHVAPDGRFLRVNRKFCDIVGYTEEEMCNLSFQEITHPDDLDIDLAYVKQVLEGEIQTYSIDKRYIRKDGSLVWISLTASLLRDQQGNPKYFVSVVKEVTDRIRAKEALDQSYHLLGHLTATVPDAIFSVKLPERVTQWCKDSYGVLGYSPQECIGESTKKLYPNAEEAAKVGVLIKKAIHSDTKVSRGEVMLRHKSGKVFPAEVNLSVFMEDNKPVSVTALARDITQRKQAEAKLQESCDLLKHLLSSIPDAVFSVKLPERVIEWADDSYNVMGLGADPSEVKQQPTQNYFASLEEYNAFGEVQRRAIEEGKRFMRTEAMVRRQDGTIFPAEITATFCRKNGVVTGANAIVRDISERKRDEKRILDYQRRLKALASQLTLVEEKERRRIAADLHDNVGQTLAITRIQLAEVISDCEDACQKEALEEISRTLLKGIRDTRQLIFELSSPSMHELGLGPAIVEWFEEQLKKTQKIDLTLVGNLAEDELDEEQRIILFRNLREILTNVIKHARAKQVKILFAGDEHQVSISVQDDGIGFDPERVSDQFDLEGGFGLFSIQERMKDLGGELEIQSKPNEGCRLIMRLPRNKFARSSHDR